MTYPLSNESVQSTGTVEDTDGHVIEVGRDHDALTLRGQGGQLLARLDSLDLAAFMVLIMRSYLDIAGRAGQPCRGVCCSGFEWTAYLGDDPARPTTGGPE